MYIKNLEMDELKYIKNDMRYIICSAIWFNDGKIHVHQPKNIETGFVICGRRHHNCFAMLKALNVDRLQFEKIENVEIQGFLTNDDMFVTREEAYEIALSANQITEHLDRKHRLFSEDIY